MRSFSARRVSKLFTFSRRTISSGLDCSELSVTLALPLMTAGELSPVVIGESLKNTAEFTPKILDKLSSVETFMSAPFKALSSVVLEIPAPFAMSDLFILLSEMYFPNRLIFMRFDCLRPTKLNFSGKLMYNKLALVFIKHYPCTTKLNNQDE